MYFIVPNLVRRVHRIGLAGLVIAAASIGAGDSGSAGAESQICEPTGWTTIEGSYVVANNTLGSKTVTQCINVTDTGFAITQLLPKPNGGQVGYPEVYLGCHWGICSPDGILPMQVGHISSATSSISFSYVNDGKYDGMYDIWLDSTPRKDGRPEVEVMILFNYQGFDHWGPAALEKTVDNLTIGGRSWEVRQWQDSGGPNINRVAYVMPSPINDWNFSVLDFINDVRSRGVITDAWYLTSIEAGFETYSGVGMAVNSFSAAVTPKTS